MADRHTLVIAEAGVNHNGDLGLAKRLAEAALEAGADVVKYQCFDAGLLVAEGARKAAYQEEATGAGESQLDMLRRLELSREEFRELKRHCDGIGIRFLATPFDVGSLAFLVEELGGDLVKVSSGEMDNWPLLVAASSYGLPVIMSTGMATTEEAVASVKVLREHGSGEVTVLHCNTQYPTPFADANVLAMPALGEACGCPYGYSDHTRGIVVPTMAVALGASVIEKHFTLDRTMEGPDHAASLEPAELAEMVAAVRAAEEALGSPEKRVTASEAGNRPVARKSIRAARRIERGELLTEGNLITKRPGDGISPMMWPEVVGTRAVRAFEADEGIEL